ncbi:restriction endonuclease subunit S [Thermomonas sp.]|uniref:restriction endonuclease subunit S n=1 Tax=Thermomonas sp. TaxID=1971895 RepID=UPI0026294DF3|nr:restriction endonuclease subunit S [Thermomonas sp.]MCO5054745.1 restriction endonuclease subunit S [Thermomonas sp.]
MGWTEAVPLGAHAQVIAGQSPDGRFYNQDGNGLPFYQGKKDFGASELQPPTKWTTQVTKEALPGDILMSVRAPVGPVNFTREKVCIGRGLAAIRCRNSMDADFLFYQLLGMQDRIAGKEGAVFASINKAEIEALPIVAPPLPEQRRIVAILDEAFEAIATAKANTEKNLQNAREVFEQQHDAIFADLANSAEPIHLGELATFRNGVNFTKRSNGCSIRIIGVKDFQSHFWAPLDDLDVVTLDGDLSPNDAVSEGDILTVRSNGNPELIGRCMVVGGLREPVTHSGFTIRISVDRGRAVPPYVCQFLRSRVVRRKLIDGGNGLNIKSLNQGMLAEVAVPLPPRDTQEQCVARIEALTTATRDLADLADRKTAALDELKKSLLHQAFTGKLTGKATDRQLEAVA